MLLNLWARLWPSPNASTFYSHFIRGLNINSFYSVLLQLPTHYRKSFPSPIFSPLSLPSVHFLCCVALCCFACYFISFIFSPFLFYSPSPQFWCITGLTIYTGIKENCPSAIPVSCITHYLNHGCWLFVVPRLFQMSGRLDWLLIFCFYYHSCHTTTTIVLLSIWSCDHIWIQ